MNCKQCHSDNFCKNGIVRGLQRYRFRECSYNFTNTKQRGKPAEMKALAVLLYGMGKASYRFIAKLLNIGATTVYNWIKHYAIDARHPNVPQGLKEIEIDEMHHFTQNKKTQYGYGKHIVVSSKELLPGWLVGVMLQPLKSSGTK